MSIKELDESKRIEDELAVLTYISRLKYLLDSGNSRINFQKQREVDKKRSYKFSNRYTILDLFPKDDPIEALKKELLKLTAQEYIKTVKDTRFPNRSEMRVFGKKYGGKNVYIKIRVEILLKGDNYDQIFIMSFHYSTYNFKESDFPYNEGGSSDGSN